MKVTFYEKEDAVYIQLLDSKVAYGKDLSDSKHLDFDESDTLVGMAFLNVSEGIDLDLIPNDDSAEVITLLEEHNIKTLV